MLMALNRNRSAKVLEMISNFVDPKDGQPLLKQYRSLLFPEQRQDDLKRLSDGRKFFEKIRDMKFTMSKI